MSGAQNCHSIHSGLWMGYNHNYSFPAIKNVSSLNLLLVCQVCYVPVSVKAQRARGRATLRDLTSCMALWVVPSSPERGYLTFQRGDIWLCRGSHFLFALDPRHQASRRTAHHAVESDISWIFDKVKLQNGCLSYKMGVWCKLIQIYLYHWL
jgi:hypothetical protein